MSATVSGDSNARPKPKPNEKPTVVCFDLGGVLIRIRRSFREGCEGAGVPLRADLDRDVDRHALAAVVDRHQRGLVDAEAFHESVSALLDGRQSADELRRVHDGWITGEYEGVAEVIDAIHAAGAATACLSNTNEAHWRSMEGLPAFDSIMHRHASHLLGLCKPDPAIFRAFEAKTGFAPHQILYFDDLIENVLAADAAGWRAELVDPLRPTAPQLRAALARHGVLAP